MSAVKKDYKRIAVKSLIEMKANGQKISMLTAYDILPKAVNKMTSTKGKPAFIF